MAIKKTYSGRGMLGYSSYSFRHKDPIIDVVRTLLDDAGATSGYIEASGGPRKATLRSWFTGKTAKPQHASISAVLKLLGMALVPHRIAHEKPGSYQFAKWIEEGKPLSPWRKHAEKKKEKARRLSLKKRAR